MKIEIVNRWKQAVIAARRGWKLEAEEGQS